MDVAKETDVVEEAVAVELGREEIVQHDGAAWDWTIGARGRHAGLRIRVVIACSPSQDENTRLRSSYLGMSAAIPGYCCAAG